MDDKLATILKLAAERTLAGRIEWQTPHGEQVIRTKIGNGVLRIQQDTLHDEVSGESKPIYEVYILEGDGLVVEDYTIDNPVEPTYLVVNDLYARVMSQRKSLVLDSMLTALQSSA